ncbi:unnamed protein product [Discula destructiva]
MGSDATAQPRPSQICVAVTQAEPVWLNLDATVDKTCALIAEAATNGAKLVTFPECWIPGYPSWIWARSVDPMLSSEYIKNSLQMDSPQMSRIQQAAAQHKIVVALGFSENHHDSLYIGQAIIDADGKLLNHRRKLKATHMERTIFGDAGVECLDSVVDTAAGVRVGALSCWEHIQPLLKFHTIQQREQIHVSAWPPVYEHGGVADMGLYSMSREGIEVLSRTYAIESQSFVLHTSAVLSELGIQKMQTQAGIIMNTPGGGCSAIFGPDGRKLSTDIPSTEEGILYATINLDDILQSKAFVDICGHYSRPDLLCLGVDSGEKEHVRDYSKIDKERKEMVQHKPRVE